MVLLITNLSWARINKEQGAYDVAIKKTMEALQNGGREDLCYLNLGLCYYYIENDSLAIAYLNKALNFRAFQREPPSI